MGLDLRKLNSVILKSTIGYYENLKKFKLIQTYKKNGWFIFILLWIWYINIPNNLLWTKERVGLLKLGRIFWKGWEEMGNNMVWKLVVQMLCASELEHWSYELIYYLRIISQITNSLYCWWVHNWNLWLY